MRNLGQRHERPRPNTETARKRSLRSDRSFDQGKDQANKKALEEIGIVIKPQDGSAVADDLETLYVSTAVEDSIPDVKAALEKNVPIKNVPTCWPKFFTSTPIT